MSRQQSASAAVCSASNISVTRISSPVFYIDTGIVPVINSGYVGYSIQTGSATSFSNLWVSAGSFSDPSKLTLAQNEDGNYRVGTMSVSTTKYSYFYLKGSATPTTQTYTLNFYEGDPSSGGILNCTISVSNTSVEEIIKASANKILSATTSTPSLGGQLLMTINGESGTMGATGLFTYTPASSSDWPADCFVLRDTMLTYSGGNSGSLAHSLHIFFTNSASTDYTVVYTFDITCDLSTETPISPKSDINSGGVNMKHTDTSSASYQSISAISATQNSLIITKSVEPKAVDSGVSTPTYNLALNNSGTTAVTVDSIRDTMSNTPASITYNIGTSIFNGAIYADPSIVGQTLTWAGPFTIPAGTTLNMLYSVTVPSTVGTYINSAVAFIGSLQIDTTIDTTDNSPATTKYYVGIPNFSTSTKTVEDLNGGTPKPGDVLRYTLAVKNTGTGPGTLVNIIDNIDSDTQNLTNVLTTDCGSVTNSSSSTQLNLSNVTVNTLNNCVITFDVTVKTPLNEGTEISNSATISGGEQNGTGANPSSNPIYIASTPNLIVTKTANVVGTGVTNGQVLNYTISILNNGDGQGSGISLSDPIDSDLIFDSGSINYTNCGSPSSDFSTSTLSITNITVNTVATCYIEYQATVSSSAIHFDLVTNGVDVSAAAEGGNDPSVTNAVELTIRALPNLSTSTKSVEDVNGGVVEPGDLLRYTIWIINTDTSPGSAIPLTDTIDTDTEALTNVTFQDCGAPVNSSTSTELNVTNITASVDVDCRVTFDVTVKSSVTEGTEISNTAHIGQAAEGGESADPSSSSLFVDTTPVIAISKTDDDADNVVDLTQTVTYTLTLTNAGNGPGTVNVTDTVTGSTSNIKNVNLTNCGGLYGTTITGQQLTITNIVVGIVNDCVITYEIDVNADAPGLSSITNTADAGAPSEGGSDPSSTSADNLTVHEDPLLAVTKTDDDADNSVVPGQVINYTINISNTGNAGTITSLTDTLTDGFGAPYDFNFTDCGSPASSFTDPETSISSITIAVGATCVITYSVQIDSPLIEGTLLYNTVDVARADPTKGNDPGPESSDTLTVDSTPNLSTSTKTVVDINGGAVQPGDTLQYTVTLVNTGNGQGTDISITDPIDSDVEGLSITSLTDCGPYLDISTASVVQIEDITVGVGVNCVLIYEVQVKAVSSENTEIANTADISPALEGGTTTYASSTTLYVDVTPVISVNKTENDVDNIVDPAQVVAYAITLSNTGDGLGTTNLTDTVIGPVSSISNITVTDCGAGYTDTSTGLNINISNLVVSVGIDCVITYDATVTSGALGGETINNTADVTAALEGGVDPSASSADILTVDYIPVLSVTKAEDDADNIVTPGQTITYTVTIRNLGNATGSTSFTDTISSYVNAPSNFTYSGCGSATANYSVPTLTVSNISVGTANDCVVTYDVVVKSPLEATNVITNTVDVAAASEGGNDPGPESASSLSLSITPDFSTSTKTVEDLNGDSVAPADVLRYTITLINSGDGTASGVSLDDTLDVNLESLTSVTFSNCGSSYSDTSTSTKLEISDLAVIVGTNCVVTFDASVKSTALDGSIIANSVNIGPADEGGSGTTKSSPDLTVDIIPNLSVTVTEDDADNKVIRTQIVAYAITITNTGNATASGVSVNAPVSGQTGSIITITTLNCGSSVNSGSSGQVLSITNASVELSTPCVITFTVSINTSAISDDQILMNADVSASAEGGNNPSIVSADTLFVQAPEIIATISFESINQVNVTEYTITYLAKLESIGTLPVNNSQIQMSLKPLINSGEDVSVIDTEIVDPFSSFATLNGNFNGNDDDYLLAPNPNTGVVLDARGGNTIGVIRVTLRLIVPVGDNIPDLSVLGTTDDQASNSNLVSVLLPDADKDGFIDSTESKTADRDGDGIVDNQDFDPQGVFYCTDNGKIIPGGLIEVSGPGPIQIVADGSNGNYQWFAKGTPGIYEMKLTAPAGTEIATDLINTGTFDPTGKDNPYSLGSNQFAQTGKLANYTIEANPVYLKFDIASGDPWIINNNIPLRNCGALALTSIQTKVGGAITSNPRRTIIIGAVLLALLVVLETVWRKKAMEKAIKPGKKFIVAAGNPRRIISRKHGIDNYIERISDKNVTNKTTTSSIHYAGWLKKTVKPGDKGLSIIGGHVYGRHKNGVFLKLNEFEKDDEFEVEFGNGSVRKFIVESVRLVKPTDVKRLVVKQEKDIEKQVNLITFADRYDRKNRYTLDRVLVIGRYKDEEESSN